MLKISAFYLEKQKSFIRKKISLNRQREFQQIAIAVQSSSEGFETNNMEKDVAFTIGPYF